MLLSYNTAFAKLINEECLSKSYFRFIYKLYKCEHVDRKYRRQIAGYPINFSKGKWE